MEQTGLQTVLRTTQRAARGGMQEVEEPGERGAAGEPCPKPAAWCVSGSAALIHQPAGALRGRKEAGQRWADTT